MSYQQTHFAINTTTNQVEIFGTKYLPATNFKGSRLSYTPINLSLEKCGPTKIVSWANECPGHGQDSQLQFTLGEGWKVLSQYDVINILKGLPVFTAQFKTGFYEDAETVLCYAGHSEIGAEIALSANTFRYGYISKWKDGKENHIKEIEGTE